MLYFLAKACLIILITFLFLLLGDFCNLFKTIVLVLFGLISVSGLKVSQSGGILLFDALSELFLLFKGLFAPALVAEFLHDFPLELVVAVFEHEVKVHADVEKDEGDEADS